MIIKQTLSILFLSAALLPAVFAQSNKATDYLNIPGPVVFDNKSFKLDWSSHPADYFYKQEYLPAGEKTGKYKTMLLVDVLTGDKTIKEVTAQKIEELKQLKQSNPVVNYNIFDNPSSGEYMIDFLLSANNPDGSMSIVERNVYRYKTFTDKNGKKGILLFGISTRAYGKDIDGFFVKLKANKNGLVNQVAKFAIPAIDIK
ncbi:MAG: hypothetical protein QM791_11165 [Ferruginibacter sp.]